MILDHSTNLKKYFKLNNHFVKVFNFLRSTDLLSLKQGKYFLDAESLIAIVSEGENKSKEKVKLEGHRKYIDLHFTIKGENILGWKDATWCENESQFNKEKDYVFFKDKPDLLIKIPEQHFAIFFPHDAHAALGGEGKIKKVVFKIAI